MKNATNSKHRLIADRDHLVAALRDCETGRSSAHLSAVEREQTIEVIKRRIKHLTDQIGKMDEAQGL
jgi:hypothetical protein